VDLLLTALLAALLGAVVAVLLTSRRRQEGSRLVDELREELTAQRRAFEDQREQSLNAAIQSVVSVASEQLGAHARAGAQQLDQRNDAVGTRLGEMAAQLERVRSLVSELDQQRAAGLADVTARLEATGQVTAQLSQTTDALRQALASPQARGQWGERMAEDVLRTAGFVHGVNYLTQQSSQTGRPDFTFPLPAGRCVHMDVKFPLDNYVRHLEAATDGERDAARAAFLRDVRRRIVEVSRRDYVDPASGTLDQVLLFLPNEHLYGFVHQSDPGLIDLALQHKVVLCSPLTLFAVLAVIRQSVDDHLTERRSAEILDTLAGFSDQWERFTEHLEKVGSRLDSARRAFDETNGVRRRQLERQLDRIDDLRTASLDGTDGAVLALPERATEDHDTAAAG
jgi:DNA recombination protein RmuC